MRLARLLLTGPDPATQQTAELLVDILWTHLEPGHHIEHITATATSSGIDLAVFVSSGVGDPARHARWLVGEIMGQLPSLHQWRCGPD
ncbi:hypothetical protein ACFYNO_24590 [Kitasatospora sp. NPDC006697]|uniref:hypothetical protein n=1 Tax=Kitasatospora sp. NPDC006697 TaxID=3364020 RepID=UPI0036CE87A1